MASGRKRCSHSGLRRRSRRHSAPLNRSTPHQSKSPKPLESTSYSLNTGRLHCQAPFYLRQRRLRSATFRHNDVEGRKRCSHSGRRLRRHSLPLTVKCSTHHQSKPLKPLKTIDYSLNTGRLHCQAPFYLRQRRLRAATFGVNVVEETIRYEIANGRLTSTAPFLLRQRKLRQLSRVFQKHCFGEEKSVKKNPSKKRSSKMG